MVSQNFEHYTSFDDRRILAAQLDIPIMGFSFYKKAENLDREFEEQLSHKTQDGFFRDIFECFEGLRSCGIRIFGRLGYNPKIKFSCRKGASTPSRPCFNSYIRRKFFRDQKVGSSERTSFSGQTLPQNTLRILNFRF